MSSEVEASLANNDETLPGAIFFPFGFRHSFVIRHSSFGFRHSQAIGEQEKEYEPAEIRVGL